MPRIAVVGSSQVNKSMFDCTSTIAEPLLNKGGGNMVPPSAIAMETHWCHTLTDINYALITTCGPRQN